MKDIIIFGAGEFGKNIYKIYKDSYNILYFCDNDSNKWNKKLFDKNIIPPVKLKEINYDTIFIASSYATQIYAQLTNVLHIEKEKIKKLYVNQSKVQFINSEKLKKTEYFMFDICKKLEKNGILYYLDHGTLLGIIRDNSFIPWDKDVDIAVLDNDESKIIDFLDIFLPSYIHPLCEQNNWKYFAAKDNIQLFGQTEFKIMELQIYNDSTSVEDEVALDLMFKYQDGDFLHWGVCGKHLKMPYQVCFPTKKIDYKSNLLNIPNQHIKYLESLYGNWQKNVKDWSYDRYTNIKDIENG